MAHDPASSPTPRAHVFAVLALVQIAAASGAVEGKIAMAPRALGGEGVAPLALTHARMIGSTAALALLLALGPKRPAGPALPGDRLRIMGLALLGITLNQTLFIAGLARTSSSNAALLAATIPVLTAVLAWALEGARPRVATWLGFVVSFVGVAILVGVDRLRDARLDLGALLIVANCLCFASYLVLGRAITRRLGSMRVTAECFAWGALFAAPFAFPVLVADAPTWTPRGAFLVAYMILVPTALTYVLNAWALARTPASTVTAGIYVQPIVAAIGAWLQLGVRPETRFFGALPFVFTGLGLVLWAERGERPSATPPISGTPSGR
jgi:drug/metabolite transporter (DMT)-like permease